MCDHEKGSDLHHHTKGGPDCKDSCPEEAHCQHPAHKPHGETDHTKEHCHDPKQHHQAGEHHGQHCQQHDLHHHVKGGPECKDKCPEGAHCQDPAHKPHEDAGHSKEECHDPKHHK
ncbi:unnamed protein product [Calicophoron daubneyi]|uniref:Uncharacterized protein n=1 Tax=Calicophoron daubneyi TaxID=300641 RepID=A0AAV2T828_CALDB